MVAGIGFRPEEPLTPTLSPQSKSAIADFDMFGTEVG
jgi:hypothetical protein